MARQPIDLKGGMVTNVEAYALRGRASLVVNWMCDEQGSNIGRPGLRAFAVPGGIPLLPFTLVSDPRVIGLHPYGDRLIAVTADRRVFALEEDGTSLNITGDYLPGSQIPTFLNDDGGKLLIFGGGQPLVWVGIGSVTKLFGTANNIPNATAGAIVLRYLILNNFGTDQLYYSKPEDHTYFDLNQTSQLVNGAGFFTAESKDDPVLAVVENWQTLFLFGSQSLDVYYGRGAEADAPFNLAWSIPRGIAGRRAVTKADTTLFWLGHDRKVYRLDKDGTPQVVSLEIERSLLDIPDVSDCIAHHIEFEGRHLVAFVFPAARTTLVHDYLLSGQGNQVWYEWREWESGKWQPMSMLAYAYHTDWRKHFCSSHTDGHLYQLDSTAYTDNGRVIRRVRRTAPVDHGTTERKRSWSYRFVCRRGATPVLDYTAKGFDPVLRVRTRSDGGTWGLYRTVALGKQGDHGTLRGELRRNGSYRARELEIVCDEPIPLHLSAIEEEFEKAQDEDD